MGILRDSSVDSELRIVSYLAVIQCPSDYYISQILETMETEEVNQVCQRCCSIILVTYHFRLNLLDFYYYKVLIQLEFMLQQYYSNKSSKGKNILVNKFPPQKCSAV